MARKCDDLPMEITEFIAEYLLEMKSIQKPNGGYKSPFLNFRATNMAIEIKVRKVFASRYLHCCQFRIDEPSLLVLGWIAKKAGLGDRIVSLWLGDLLSRPTTYFNENRVAVFVASLHSLKHLELGLEWWRSAPYFLHSLSTAMSSDVLTKFSLNKAQIDDRVLVRILKGQRALQDFSLYQINVRGSFTGVYAAAKDLIELRYFNLHFVWNSKQPLHFTDTDQPPSRVYADSTMERGKLWAKLRAPSHEGMCDALNKLELIATYDGGRCCSMGACCPKKFWTQWKRIRNTSANESSTSEVEYALGDYENEVSG